MSKKTQTSATSRALKKTVRSLPAGLTGILASKREDWILSIGYLFQRSRNRTFLESLQREWDVYVERGRIKDGYEDTEQHKSCLQELLDALDKDSPDQVRFDAIKNVFLNAAMEELTDRSSVLPQQYMRICRSLTSGEVLVLRSAYRINKDGSWRTQNLHAGSVWLEAVAKESGLVFPELVDTHEEALIRKNLLSPRVYPDRSAIAPGNNYRLTTLALNLCSFIEALSAP